MHQASLEARIAELRIQRRELIARPPGTTEENFALDLEFIDVDLEVAGLEDQIDRETAWAFTGRR